MNKIGESNHFHRVIIYRIFCNIDGRMRRLKGCTPNGIKWFGIRNERTGARNQHFYQFLITTFSVQSPPFFASTLFRPRLPYGGGISFAIHSQVVNPNCIRFIFGVPILFISLLYDFRDFNSHSYYSLVPEQYN